jgi:hypothetical protein
MNEQQREVLPRGQVKESKANRAKDDSSIHKVLSTVANREDVHLSSTTKPLGATMEEIDMLNKFLSIAGPNFNGSEISIEDRDKLHDDALNAGLSEAFINKLLDQSAGIRRWEEQSMASETSSLADSRSRGRCRRPREPNTPSESTCGRSLGTKSTMDSDMSHSTKYTKDTESISYYTYDDDGFTRRLSPKTEVLAFGCADQFEKYFWMESKVTGQDMLDNVAAAMSRETGSVNSDDGTRDKRERR